VKARLLGNTSPGPVGNPFVDGHGALNAYAAATSGPMNLSQSTFLVLPTLPGMTVSLQPTGPADSWNPSLWSGLTTTPVPATSWAWNSWAWNGAAWNGYAWNSWAWNSWAWNDAAWNSWAWNSWAWNDAAWQGSAWNGTAWNGTAWNSSSWN
jgi:hypothetical protein